MGEGRNVPQDDRRVNSLQFREWLRLRPEFDSPLWRAARRRKDGEPRLRHGYGGQARRRGETKGK